MTSDTYIQVTFINVEAEKSALLMALLEADGFEGFEEEELLLKAFIPETAFSTESLERIAHQQNATYNITTIQPQNWNAVWEENFEPVVVNDFVGIRANFHQPIKDVLYEIVITPKMSFGTGHHATTHMMIAQMRNINFTDKTVFDFGTGTGILAILAEILGAKSITAVDIDAWSIENAKENIEKNNCTKIELQQEDHVVPNQEFDIILANINKNIILDNIEVLTSILSKNGLLLLSGLLGEDEEDILFKTRNLNLKHINTISRAQWICIFLGR